VTGIEREVLGWDVFADASRQLSKAVLSSGFQPDVVIAIARGGLLLAGAMSYALGTKNCGSINVRTATLYTKPRTVLVPDFTWCETDRWIVFPWSSLPPVAESLTGASLPGGAQLDDDLPVASLLAASLPLVARGALL